MNAGRFLATRIQAIFVTRKTFGKYIQPFFSEKRKISNKIIFVDDDDAIVSDDQSISEKQTKHLFKNAAKSLNIRQNSYLTEESNETEDQERKLFSNIKTIQVSY